MRGYITRRFSETHAIIGYYDMKSNKMVEVNTFVGGWKNTEQVLKWCKKNRENIGIPEGKQATVLSLETKSHLRKMTYQRFYDNSEPVEETPKETKKAATKTNNKKKGKR